MAVVPPRPPIGTKTEFAAVDSTAVVLCEVAVVVAGSVDKPTPVDRGATLAASATFCVGATSVGMYVDRLTPVVAGSVLGASGGEFSDGDVVPTTTRFGSCLWPDIEGGDSSGAGLVELPIGTKIPGPAEVADVPEPCGSALFVPPESVAAGTVSDGGTVSGALWGFLLPTAGDGLNCCPLAWGGDCCGAVEFGDDA
jgi:hypothetical protein